MFIKLYYFPVDVRLVIESCIRKLTKYTAYMDCGAVGMEMRASCPSCRTQDSVVGTHLWGLILSGVGGEHAHWMVHLALVRYNDAGPESGIGASNEEYLSLSHSLGHFRSLFRPPILSEIQRHKDEGHTLY